jgi:hypothetical protein
MSTAPAGGRERRKKTEAPQKNMMSTSPRGITVQVISRTVDSWISVAISSGDRRRYLIAK